MHIEQDHYKPSAMKFIFTTLLCIFIFHPSHCQFLNAEWLRTAGGTQNEWSQGIAVGPAGGTYMAGYFRGTADFDPGAGTANHSSVGFDDIFVQKLDDNGDYQWSYTLGSTTNDRAHAIHADTENGVYVAGVFHQFIDFDPGPGTSTLSASNPTCFLQKVDSSGSFEWAKSLSGSGLAVPRKIRTDDSLNIYVAGRFGGQIDFDPGTGTEFRTSNAYTDMFLLKLDSEGEFVWVRHIGSGNGGFLSSMAIDEDQNVLLGGSFSDTMDFDPGPGVYVLNTPTFTSNGIVVKFDCNGNFIWVRTLVGADGSWVQDVVADEQGNIYSVGKFRGTVDFDPGPGVDAATGVWTYDDGFLHKMDANGNYLWAHQFGDSILDWTTGVGVVDGGPVICGIFNKTVDLDPGPSVMSATSLWDDSYVARFDSNGNFLGAGILGGDESEFASYLEVNEKGEVRVGGDFNLTIDTLLGPQTGFATASGTTAREVFQLSLKNCFSFLNVDTITACNAFTWVDGNTYSSTTDSIFLLLPLGDGCDSIFQLDLTIPTVETSVTVAGTAIFSNAVGATYQWLHCDSGYAPIAGATAVSYTPATTGNYAAEILQNGCVDTTDCIFITIVGMEEQMEGVPKLYPNPFEEHFWLETAGQEEWGWRVFAVDGREVANGRAGKGARKHRVAFEGSSGLYLLEISTGNYRKQFTVLKK